MLSACVIVRPVADREMSPTLKSSRNGPSVTRGMLDASPDGNSSQAFCSGRRTRTSDHGLNRAPLYQLSYAGPVHINASDMDAHEPQRYFNPTSMI
jgi:hypothetical protein